MKYDPKSIFFSVLFHGILLLMLVFFGFSTPLPLPSEKGFVIDFGHTVVGRGNKEPAKTVAKPVRQQVQQTDVVKETFMTQDVEEAPSIPNKKKENVKADTKITQKQEVNVEEKVEVEKEERKPNPFAAYKGIGSTQSSGEGDDGTEGNKGSQEGIEAGSHFVGSKGGMGVADVGGRVPSSLPNPDYIVKKEGVVVVFVRVDRRGKVVNARISLKGTTISDNALWEAAEKAALASIFESKSGGEMYNEGTITYHFKLE